MADNQRELDVKYAVVKRMLNNDALMIVQRHLAELAGDEELMIYRWPDGSWEIHLGNPSPHVMLGEISGNRSADGATLQEAVEKLAAELEGQQSTSSTH